MRPVRVDVRRATGADAVTLARLLHDFNTEYAIPTPGGSILVARLRRLLVDDAVFALLARFPPSLRGYRHHVLP